MRRNWKLVNRVWHANIGMLSVLSMGVIALSCPFIAHGWEAGQFLVQIHYGKFLPKDIRWVWIDSQGALLGLLVLSGFLMHRKSVKKATERAADDPAAAGSSVTVMGAAGNDVLALEAERQGLRAFRCHLSKDSMLDLSQERWLVISQGADLQELSARVSALKPGALKRLEYSLDPALENEALDASLQLVGASPMRLSSGSEAWADRVIHYLSARSSLLKRRPAPPAAPVTPQVAASAGFSLIELVVCMAVLSIMVSVGTSTFGYLSQRDQVRAAAQDFAAMAREAHQIARRENVLVRLAFNSREAEKSTAAETGAGLSDSAPLRHACSLLVFRVPAQQITSAVTVQPTRMIDASPETSEALLLGRVPLIEPLLGGWTKAPGYEKWHRWDDLVEVEGELLSAFVQSPEETARRFAWKPAKYWTAGSAGSAEVSPCSPYPVDFALTPYPYARQVVMQPLDGALQVEIPHAGYVKATDVWGDAPVPQWDSAAAAESRFPLPMLDFLPSGGIAYQEQEQLEFRFSSRRGKAVPVRVLIRCRDAAVTIIL